MQSGDWKRFLQAAIDNDLETVRFYLHSGADPNYLHPEIMTNPIIEASRLDHCEIVELLMAHGANPKLVSQMGESAYTIARNQKNARLLQLFKR